MTTLIDTVGDALRDTLRASTVLQTILGQTDSVTNLEYSDQPREVSPLYGGAAHLRFSRIDTPVETAYEDSAQSTITYAFGLLLQDVAGAGRHLAQCATAVAAAFEDRGAATVASIVHGDFLGDAEISVSIDADPIETVEDNDNPVVTCEVMVKLWHVTPLTV